jgi:hypothetical protein
LGKQVEAAAGQNEAEEVNSLVEQPVSRLAIAESLIERMRMSALPCCRGMSTGLVNGRGIFRMVN